MKVWQAGSHLTDERGARVADWSWRRTRRRLGLLARLTLPYKGRTALAIGSLLAFTVVGLAPPYLAKLAVDKGLERPAWAHRGEAPALLPALLAGAWDETKSGDQEAISMLADRPYQDVERSLAAMLRAAAAGSRSHA